MSLHHPSMRLALGLALFVLATTVAPASAAPRQVSATPAPAAFPATSCQGSAACTGAVGPIGENSCNNAFACTDSLGAIGDNSCNGFDACQGAFGPIGDNSCNESYSCIGSGAIGDNSCNDLSACWRAASAIGNNSCNGDSACDSATFSVGNNSCNGIQACNRASGDIGDCEYNLVPQAACTQPDGRIRRVGRTNLVGNDVYNTDATDQTLTATLKPGDKVRFSITIQNDGEVADSFTLHAICGVIGINAVGPAGVPGIKFVTGRPGQDITDAIGSGSYETPTIAPDGKFRLRSVVKGPFINASLGTAGVTQVQCLVTATSVGNPANVDAVKFIVYIEQTPT